MVSHKLFTQGYHVHVGRVGLYGLRQLQKLISVCCNKLLIGCDNTFAREYAALRIIVCYTYSAYGLDDHLDFRIILNYRKVLNNYIFKLTVREIAYINNVFYAYLTAGALCYLIPVC